MGKKTYLEFERTTNESVFFFTIKIRFWFFVGPGHAGMSQFSDCWVSEQEGPSSESLQRRVLVLWPCPQETEQELQELQGSYTGQESLVHTRVPFSHTL